MHTHITAIGDVLCVVCFLDHTFGLNGFMFCKNYRQCGETVLNVPRFGTSCKRRLLSMSFLREIGYEPMINPHFCGTAVYSIIIVMSENDVFSKFAVFARLRAIDKVRKEQE